MCGISLFLQYQDDESYSEILYKYFKNISKRGPDRSNYLELMNKVNMKIGFHRLSIMDQSTKGDQPFKYESKGNTIYVICNGEIYNYLELVEKEKLIDKNFSLNSKSDCEIIGHLYLKYGIDNLVSVLEGEYAFMICDVNMNSGNYKIYACNDRFGIRPLFVATSEKGFFLSSEVKGIPLEIMKNYKIDRFKPRNYCLITKNNNEIDMKYTEYYNLSNIKTKIYDIEIAKKSIYESFFQCINKMVASDRNIGCLLSGGLDNSLVSSIVSYIYKNRYNKKIRTFSIGLEGSTDEYYAKLVSKYIDSEHTHIILTEKDFLESLDQVIKTIETFDITTIRASTPQYLISKWISQNTDIKVLFTGDGSDELSGGYMYFHKAPSKDELHKENIKLLDNIHYFDGLRADRCIAGNGMEARFPFLNHNFVETYLSIDPKLRLPNKGIEKWLLRESFNNSKLLPNEVLFRKKEAFSDACSSLNKSWYQIIQDYVDKLYTEQDVKLSCTKYTYLVPYTKESLYYRDTFTKYYGDGNVQKIIPNFWLPNKDWCGDITDPSARTLDVYQNYKCEL